MSGPHHGRVPPPPPAARAFARDIFGNEVAENGGMQPQSGFQEPDAKTAPASKEKATDALGRRAGALLDEIDFPAFVASLVDGTFNAITDSTIRQMEAYADLVAAVAKPLDQFARENVTRNQTRDWLAEQYPGDIQLEEAGGGEFRLAPVAKSDEEEFAEAPSWLSDFGHAGAELSPEFLEDTLLPIARERVAQQRLSTLSTMVLLGMNRVVVKDGTIGARLRFRASAGDHATVQYATANDPQTGVTEWGRRGGGRGAVTRVSTVDVNAQSDTELEARLYGDVKINFASETVPLDRFLDQAQQALLERHSRMRKGGELAPQSQLPAPAPAPDSAPAPAQAPAPAPAAPPVTGTVPPPPAPGGTS